MYRGLLVLFLVLETRRCESSSLRSQRSDLNEGPSFHLSARNLHSRYNNFDYDTFIGLMGRRNADTDDSLPSQRERKFHDVFVGLMGRRSSETGTERLFRHHQIFKLR